MFAIRATVATVGTVALVAVLAAGCSSADGSTGAAPVAVATTTTQHPPATTSPTTAPTTPPTTTASANPCAGNRAAQLVRVSLAEQHLWMCARTRLVRDTPITSGMDARGDHTPTGHFTIQGRNRNSVLTLSGGKQYDVAYWIPFHAPLYGFHDSPWQTIPYGSPLYRTGGSHGCVHMPLAAIGFLYRWVEIGAKVVIA